MRNDIPPTITEAFTPLPLNELICLVKDFAGMPISEQKNVIGILVSVHPIFNLNWKKGWRYRRVRKLEINESPSTVCDVIWRKNAPAQMARANSTGFPVIYLAHRQDTAFSEVGVINDNVVISEYEILPTKAIRVAPIGEIMNIQRTGRGFLTPSSQCINEMLNACNLNEARSLLITDSFLFDCLNNRENNYELSSHVAMSIFKKSKVTAIAYPSQRQFGGMNFAVRTENFWSDWGIRSVRFGKAKHLAQGYYKLENVKHVNGITCEGKFIWGIPKGDEDNIVQILEPLWFDK